MLIPRNVLRYWNKIQTCKAAESDCSVQKWRKKEDFLVNLIFTKLSVPYNSINFHMHCAVVLFKPPFFPLGPNSCPKCETTVRFSSENHRGSWEARLALPLPTRRSARCSHARGSPRCPRASPSLPLPRPAALLLALPLPPKQLRRGAAFSSFCTLPCRSRTRAVVFWT